MSGNIEDTWLARLPLFRAVLERVPENCRTALFYETFYNYGSGTFIALFLLTLAAIKTVVDGQAIHLTLLAALFGGSSLLSPVVGYLSRKIPSRLLIIVPNLITAVLLLAIALPIPGPTFFTCVVGCAFVLRVFPRVSEMNMFRILYPATHRGFAVGWIKAVAAVSALLVTLAGTWWFNNYGDHYWVVYAYAAGSLVFASACYSRIPIPPNEDFTQTETVSVWKATQQGWRVFLADKRFVRYQFGFALAGFANHMGMALVPEALKDQQFVGASNGQVLVVTAVLPALLIMASAPFWGRYLDKVDPMTGRALFNAIQMIGYGLYCCGGVTGQLWLMIAGTVFHAVSNGGGTINWSTGSLYFARPEHVSLYNSLHVGFTGLRGLIAPICGFLLFKELQWGPWMFAVAAALSLLGSVYMYRLARTDTGSVETGVTTAKPDIAEA